MPTSTKCQKIEKKMTINVYNMMIGYDITTVLQWSIFDCAKE
jgi:hypothetical protein